jgi:hypothetical protein
MRDGTRSQGYQSGKPRRRGGWRSIGQIADDLIERLQKEMVANDNKPARLIRTPAPAREADD